MKQISLRAARGKMTQEALAAKSGVPQEVISRIETGVTPNPSWDTVSKLADALGIDPRRLKFGQREAMAS